MEVIHIYNNLCLDSHHHHYYHHHHHRHQLLQKRFCRLSLLLLMAVLLLATVVIRLCHHLPFAFARQTQLTMIWKHNNLILRVHARHLCNKSTGQKVISTVVVITIALHCKIIYAHLPMPQSSSCQLRARPFRTLRCQRYQLRHR